MDRDTLFNYHIIVIELFRREWEGGTFVVPNHYNYGAASGMHVQVDEHGRAVDGSDINLV